MNHRVFEVDHTSPADFLALFVRADPYNTYRPKREQWNAIDHALLLACAS